MTNQYMLAGSVIHDAIEWYLKIVRLGRCPTLNDLEEMATNKIRRAWRQSVKRRWEHNPKNSCNLFEHYYDREIDTERMKSTIADCLNNFYTYALPIVISCKDSWKALEEFQSIDTGNYTVMLSMDLAYELDGRIHIVDWKTGKSSGTVVRQLLVYALYATRQWGYIPSEIQTTAYYLRSNSTESFIPEVGSLLGCVEWIGGQVNAMSEYLVDCDLELNEPLHPREFPRTEDEWKCDSCFYREVCHGK